MKHFGFHMKLLMEEAEISLQNIHNNIQLSSSHWLFKSLMVILNLTKLTKKNTPPLIYREKLSYIQENYPNYSHIYTD